MLIAGVKNMCPWNNASNIIKSIVVSSFIPLNVSFTLFIILYIIFITGMKNNINPIIPSL